MASLSRQKFTVPQMPLPSRAEFPATFNSTYLTDIPSTLAQWNCTRTVLVVSRALDANTDKVARLEKVLGAVVVGKKIGVGAHTPYPDVLAIALLLQENQADSIVCIGSSSYSDACKIARLLVAKLSPENLTEQGMEDTVDQEKGATPHGFFNVPTAKLICVPCSLSVSEYNPTSSATNSKGKKQHFGEFKFVDAAPNLVLLDPEIAATAPAETLWLPSGVRAIDHCIETLIGRPLSDEGIKTAERGLKALVEGLKTYKDGLGSGKLVMDEDILQGISECQRGARDGISGVFCFGSHMGPSHAIGHQLGSVGKVAHGLTSCVCLAPTLRYEKRHPEVEYWDVEKHKRVLEIFNTTLGWQELDVADAVEKFFRSLGLPTKLSEVGVSDEEDLKQIAEQTMTDIWGGGPRQINDPQAIMEILNDAR